MGGYRQYLGEPRINKMKTILYILFYLPYILGMIVLIGWCNLVERLSKE
jgi:hypothetical protein